MAAIEKKRKKKNLQCTRFRWIAVWCQGYKRNASVRIKICFQQRPWTGPDPGDSFRVPLITHLFLLLPVAQMLTRELHTCSNPSSHPLLPQFTPTPTPVHTYSHPSSLSSPMASKVYMTQGDFTKLLQKNRFPLPNATVVRVTKDWPPCSPRDSSLVHF